MNDQLAAIAKQRGKVVALFVVCSFALAWRHPEMIAAIWGPAAGAVGALGVMEAWASSKGTE